jgi:hypothetical protein
MRKSLEPDLENSVNVVKSDAEWQKTSTPEEFSRHPRARNRARVQSPLLSREARGHG